MLVVVKNIDLRMDSKLPGCLYRDVSQVILSITAPLPPVPGPDCQILIDSDLTHQSTISRAL